MGNTKAIRKVTTTKKVKIVGQQDFINSETGEVVPMNVINVEDADYNFTKLWLGHIIQALEIIGNKKIKVINFIMENMDKSNNVLIMTQNEISEKCGVSRMTVNETIKALEESNFLTCKNGVYRVNPEVLFRGSHGKRMNVLLQYRQMRNSKTGEEE